MLSITPDFTIQDIQKDFKQFEEDIKHELIESLTKTLHNLVDTARAKTKPEGGFGNITWNLRGSIGGVIMAGDGEIIETYFPPIGKGEEGREKGIGYAIDIAHMDFDGEILLVFVAGELYAGYVEGRDDIDVISGTNKKFEQFFKSALGK